VHLVACQSQFAGLYDLWFARDTRFLALFEKATCTNCAKGTIRKSETRNPKSETKSNEQNSNVEDGRRQKSGDRRQKTEDRRQNTEDRIQKTEDRRQKTEDRRRKTEDGRNIECRTRNVECRSERIKGRGEGVKKNIWILETVANLPAQQCSLSCIMEYVHGFVAATSMCIS